MTAPVLPHLVAAVLAAVLAAAPVPVPGDTADPTAAILAELQAYYTHFSARDWDAFADHFWPGATLASAWRPPGEEQLRITFTSVPEFVDRAPDGPGSRAIFEERMLDAHVRVRGGLAQVWARYAARFGDPGDIMEWTGTDAFTLLRRDGRWRIIALAYASDDDPDPEADPEPEPDPEPDPDPDPGQTGGAMTIESLTPILYVEAIEPLLPFWVDRLGFQVVSEVEEGDRLGFVILDRGGTQLMVQTRASIQADVPSLADTPTGGTILFIRVADLDALMPALDGLDVLVPRRTTFYGADEIFVREPGGNVVGFAEFPGEE